MTSGWVGNHGSKSQETFVLALPWNFMSLRKPVPSCVYPAFYHLQHPALKYLANSLKDNIHVLLSVKNKNSEL